MPEPKLFEAMGDVVSIVLDWTKTFLHLDCDNESVMSGVTNSTRELGTVSGHPSGSERNKFLEKGLPESLFQGSMSSQLGFERFGISSLVLLMVVIDQAKGTARAVAKVIIERVNMIV